MDATPSGSERLQGARARALLIALPLLALVWGGSAAMLYRDFGLGWEPLLHLIGCVLILGLFWPTLRAVRRNDFQGQERIGLLLLSGCSLLLLQRVISLMFDTALRNPDLSLFRPVFAFLPMLYLGALLLLPARRALPMCWLIGAVVLGVTGLAIFANDWRLSEHGLPELLFWLLLGNPLILIALYGLPDIEDAMLRSSAELGELRHRMQLAEQLTESEARFDRVIHSLQVGAWDQRFENGELVGLWWSSRYYELLGYTPQNLPASEASERVLFGESYLLVRSALHAQLRSRNGLAAVDSKLLTAHRGWRWFNICAKAEFDSQGRFVRITGAIEDIHDQRSAEERLLEAQSELSKLAYRDALTGLPNRRAFDERLHNEWERARRVGQSISILAIDLDWFKHYNDLYGHPAGDEGLRRLAGCLSSCLRRPADFAARVGGEEFFVVLPETEADGAFSVATNIENSLRQQGLPHARSLHGVVTCSIGVATGHPREGGSPAELIERADEALYQSKGSGRGRVTRSAR